MEENKTYTQENAAKNPNKRSLFDPSVLFKLLILNWKWFILSLIICLGLAYIKLRYSTTIYQTTAKMLVKAERQSSRSQMNVQGMANLGLISQTEGFDNELEIVRSKALAADVVRDLDLNVDYTRQGKIRSVTLYKDNPVSVSLDSVSAEKLTSPIALTIERDGNNSIVEVFLTGNTTGKADIKKTVSTFPFQIPTRKGTITLRTTDNYASFSDGDIITATINSPERAARNYKVGATQFSRGTFIMSLQLTDAVPERSIDFLKQLVVAYNRQANDDKNQVALRTERFINDRIEKINAELGSTEDALEEYKKSHGLTDLKSNAGQALGNQNVYEQRLAEINVQMALFNSVNDFMNQAINRYQTLPSGIGIEDPTATSLISRYNEIVLQRNRLLRTASESNPSVTPLTAQLDELNLSIRRALSSSRRNIEIERSSIMSQLGKYSGQVGTTPEMERVLNQIGRQQDVKSGLYLMLLQKREENSISLAATADKGKLIDDPETTSIVSPNRSQIYLTALALGLLIPALIILLLQLLRFKIEGHDDVAGLTALPIIADVPVANESVKSKADIVVHENKNSQMEEIFRAMRTNLQFMLKENEKVILFTSTTSGEGKTFNASNIAVSFALLGKRTVLVGLDIRRPRLAEQFGIHNKKTGITNLLVHDNPSEEDILHEIIPSGVNPNLDLLLAGPIPPNPTELVARPSLDVIFNSLRNHYDYILIDTAPVGLVSDTLQIGRVSDISVYMCRADYTPRNAFEMINELADSNKLPNMCIVLNGIDMTKKKYGYYYGYGRYGHYGKFGRYGRYSYYSSYGNYQYSHYSSKDDKSIKQ